MSFCFTHSSWKLQELDLRDVYHDFWNGCAGMQHVVCSPDVICMSKPSENCPIPEEKGALTILLNLSILSHRPSKYLRYFYHWAKQRKDVIRVISPKLTFHAVPAYDPLYLLEVFDPSSIQELEIKTCWDMPTLIRLAPGLGQMKSLEKLIFKEISVPLVWRWTKEIIAWSHSKILPHFSKLHKLQHLYLNEVCFVEDSLEQVLG